MRQFHGQMQCVLSEKISELHEKNHVIIYSL